MITLLKTYLERFYKLAGSTMKYAFLVNFLLFGLVLLLVTPTYETNDDVGMIIIESGNSNMLEPSEYVLFSNILLGKILKNLNIINNQIPWHTIYIILALFASYSILFYTLIKRLGYKYATLFYVIIFFTYGVNSLIALQFTKTASILAISAYMLLFYDYKSDNQNENIVVRYLVAVLLFVFSSLIRFDSFFLISLIFSPVFFYIFFLNKVYLLKRFGILVVSFFLIIAGFLYNNAAYKKWGNFMEYNVYRATIVDYDAFEKLTDKENKELLQKVQWSENDKKSICSWFFADSNVYSLEKLKIIHEYTNDKITDKTHLLHLTVDLLKSKDLKKFASKMFVLTLFLFFIALINGKKKEFIISVTILFIVALLFIAISIFYKVPPNRVLEGMLWAIVVFSFLLIDKIVLFGKKNYYYFLIFLIFALNNIRIIKADNNLRHNSGEYKNYVNWLISNEEKYTYFSFKGASCNEHIPAYSNVYQLHKTKIVSLGTLQNSPAMMSTLNKIGIKDGLLLKHLDNPNFVFLYKDKRVKSSVLEHPDLDNILMFMKEHYGITGHFKEIASFPINKMLVHAVQFERDMAPAH
ncbi:hypothetical protein SAMN05421780_11211 [Flexibacter flexilis DSM 6793]|uniref:Dolichyl-phosphate-mannose-protein mannosyltransferase n=1 Tax=Flexibacter flexilis DSM 6793 TaxID=927664 RepID=A0A1I1N015_9BACT|nr:hypothetical protein [Flexibacter flexilis]SFC90977.1 hypothetical protein SAMN05421780_11211 [Flexibacter flexilis DSM 6793]